MQKPFIHSNGTSARCLAEGYSAARVAVENAIEELSKVEFNARDYYIGPEGAWKQAQAEHVARFDRLRAVAAELSDLEAYCCEFIRQ